MRCLFVPFCVFLTSLMAVPQTGFAAAWLRKDNELAVILEHTDINYDITLFGNNAGLTRDINQLYFEYGVSDKTNLIGKYHVSHNSINNHPPHIKTEIYELSMRKPAKWAKIKLLPPGLKPLWKLFSPEKPITTKAASFEIGGGWQANLPEAEFHAIVQLAMSEKIATTHTHPIYFYVEAINIFHYRDEERQEAKLVSRMELGHRRAYLAYERLDSRGRDIVDYQQHIWYGEVGFDITPHLTIFAKSGRERNSFGLPPEDVTTIGVEMKLNPSAQIRW